MKINRDLIPWVQLTHWGRVTHICVVKLTIIGSDNGLSPGRRQAIIWTSAGLLSIGPLATQFIEMLIEIPTFSFTKMHLKMSSGKWRPFCLGLNVLTCEQATSHYLKHWMPSVLTYMCVTWLQWGKGYLRSRMIFLKADKEWCQDVFIS